LASLEFIPKDLIILNQWNWFFFCQTEHQPRIKFLPWHNENLMQSQPKQTISPKST
jgi:hypothetical protein